MWFKNKITGAKYEITEQDTIERMTKDEETFEEIENPIKPEVKENEKEIKTDVVTEDSKMSIESTKDIESNHSESEKNEVKDVKHKKK